MASRYASLGLSAGLLLATAVAWPAEYVALPAGSLSGVLATDADRTPAPVAPFSMRVEPVTQEEYRRFVTAQPEWRRDRVPQTFAGAGYLQGWATPLNPTLDPASPSGHRPVVSVSWFAAQAFCE